MINIDHNIYLSVFPKVDLFEVHIRSISQTRQYFDAFTFGASRFLNSPYIYEYGVGLGEEMIKCFYDHVKKFAKNYIMADEEIARLISEILSAFEILKRPGVIMNDVIRYKCNILSFIDGISFIYIFNEGLRNYFDPLPLIDNGKGAS